MEPRPTEFIMTTARVERTMIPPGPSFAEKIPHTSSHCSRETVSYI